VPDAFDLAGVNRARFEELSKAVGQLDLAGAVALGGGQRREDVGGQHVPPDNRQVGRRFVSWWFLHEVAHLVDAVAELGGRLDGPVLAVERVPRDQISSYGVIAIESNAALGDGIYQVRDLVEKPPKEEAPSDLAIIGRYVLTPDIFPALATTKSDRTGEIQLTNGLRELLKTRPIYACEVKGVRHDTGNKLGFLKAVVYFALRRPDLAGKFTEYLAALDLRAPVGKQ